MTPTAADAVPFPTPPASLPVTGPGSGWADPAYLRNRAAIPEGELARWYGHHVACTWDGTRILAGAATLEELFAFLDRDGVDTSTVALDYVDHPDATYL